MPRFGLSDWGSPPPSTGFESPSLRFPTMQSPPLNSPPTSQNYSSPPYTMQSLPESNNNQYEMTLRSPPNQLALGHSQRRSIAESSVNLCCCSGDGTTVFCLGAQGGQYFIERRSLPLHDETETAAQPQRQLRLPQRIQTALSLSPPVELLYVEADAEYSNTTQLLCLYTRKQVFYLDVPTTTAATTPTNHQQQQATIDVTAAFEHYFMNADDAVTIVRIRPAPQRRDDYATLCPRGAMAMFTHNPNYNQYSLVLQHDQNQSLVSSPLVFSLEDLSGRDQNITDFCFAKSEGLSLLSSLTVLLVKGSGDVLAASPILFDGSVVAHSKLQESSDFLDYQIQTLSGNNNGSASAAKCNQCKSAKAFLRDAFGSDDASSSKSHFRTAKVLSEGRMYSAVTWPVQIQGPFVAMPRDHHPQGVANHAVVIEPVSASELIGIAVGGEGYSIDLGMVSPSSLLPRFAHESAEDGYELDDALSTAGTIVQRLLLNDDEGAQDGPSSSGGLLSNQSLALVPDSLMYSMMHYVTPSGVMTVNTTAMRHVLRNIQGGNTGLKQSASAKPKTSAWSSVTASSGTIVGAVVGNDTRFGHALIARLSNGTMVPVNVTESRYLQEMDHLIHGETVEESQKQLTNSTPSAAATKQMESMPPLYKEVDPLMKKISAGLAGMGKIVGSQTKCKDVQPDMMAVALSVKERCDNEVVLPMLELKETVNARREVLLKMRKDQMQQIAALKQTVNTIQERMAAIEAKAETAQENSVGLSKRSTAVLQASQDLLPTLTQAEYDYFQQLKRLRANLEDMEKGFEKLDKTLGMLRNSMDQGRIQCSVNMSPAMVNNAELLLDGEDKILTKIETGMRDNEEISRRMMEDAGLVVTEPPGGLSE